jgi:hypothetical protein
MMEKVQEPGNYCFVNIAARATFLSAFFHLRIFIAQLYYK